MTVSASELASLAWSVNATLPICLALIDLPQVVLVKLPLIVLLLRKLLQLSSVTLQCGTQLGIFFLERCEFSLRIVLLLLT